MGQNFVQSGQQRHRLHDDQRSQILQSRGALRIGANLCHGNSANRTRGQERRRAFRRGASSIDFPDAPASLTSNFCQAEALYKTGDESLARTSVEVRERAYRYGRQTGRIAANAMNSAYYSKTDFMSTARRTFARTLRRGWRRIDLIPHGQNDGSHRNMKPSTTPATILLLRPQMELIKNNYKPRDLVGCPVPSANAK